MSHVEEFRSSASVRVLSTLKSEGALAPRVRDAPTTSPSLPRRSPSRGERRRGSRLLSLPRFRLATSLLLLVLLCFFTFSLWAHSVLRPRRYPLLVPGARVLELPTSPFPPLPFGTVQLVVARFSDDLAWLPGVAELLNASTRVYCKEAPPDVAPPDVACDHVLPNVGNEGASYLAHLKRASAATRGNNGGGADSPSFTVFLPDTLWRDETQAKPHFARDVFVAVRRAAAAHARRLASLPSPLPPPSFFADMHLPDTAPRAAVARFRERWQGMKLPCGDSEEGGATCAWRGTTSSSGNTLAPASPATFGAWAMRHAGVTSKGALRSCGWSFRGVFAASSTSIAAHPPRFYELLEAELSGAVFPVAGMYMERLWRWVLLCHPSQ